MKRSTMLVGVAIIVVLLLASAAYVGGRLLTRAGQAGQSLGSGEVSVISRKGGEASTTIRGAFQIEPAKELPSTQPDAAGIFLRRDERSVFIGTGNVTANARQDPSGKVDVTMTHDGPVVEVVTTSDTLVYRDATPLSDNPTSGENIQQVVEPGNLDDLGPNMGVAVWGPRRGDRIVAQVLLYRLPSIKTMGK